jgi:peptidoglycan/LPS O-acetylase OafA/YrhL
MTTDRPDKGLHRNAMVATDGASTVAFVDSDLSFPVRAVTARRSLGVYVPEVDALRGMAMTGVIAIHCGLLPFGWMGVWLFFVVSGFAVTTSLFTAQHRVLGVWDRIGSFYVRRALRIWPVYFAFIGVNIIVLLALGMYGALQDVPWLLSFTQNLKMIITVYTPGTAWPAFGHLWTLAIEQQFYLIFPLLLLLPGRRSRSLLLLGVIAAAPLIRFAVGQWAAARGWDSERIAFAVYAFGPAHFDAFAVGALIALFRVEITQDRRLARAAAILAAAITVVYVAAYAAVGVIHAGHLSVGSMRNIVSGIMYGQGREVAVYFVPTVITAALLMGILAGERRCLRLCGSPGLQAIGRISYGGYLFHIPVLMVLGALVPVFGAPVTGPLSYAAHAGLFVCAYPITAGVAWLSFMYFEQRFSRMRRRHG